MTAADAQTRNNQAGEHLALLRSLACELERAMQAIGRNDLAELEGSISNQQDLSSQLTELARERREPVPARREQAPARPEVSGANIDGDLGRQVHAAAAELQKLNLRYSLLIEHSSRSAAQMAALFRSFRGELQEDSGARVRHRTLSCQV